ncbi:MAG: hypothetical protein U5K31_10745 [Balneolaceae bacterium]|nr:hypothetical protein [Balneolaceae bacterium]
MEIFTTRAFEIFNLAFLRSLLMAVLTFGMLALAGCDSPTSSEDGATETRTFDLILSSDNSTKVGEITTSEITEESDAYIDEGFFITITLSSTDFNPPFGVDLTEAGGICGTWDVQPDEKAEMPCDYEQFLDAPDRLIVSANNGDGEEAYAE